MTRFTTGRMSSIILKISNIDMKHFVSIRRFYKSFLILLLLNLRVIRHIVAVTVGTIAIFVLDEFDEYCAAVRRAFLCNPPPPCRTYR
jgi:hypothetical protein